MAYYLITFLNTHSAIATQNYLKDKLHFQIMPTLREISSSCGISLKITGYTLEEITDTLKAIGSVTGSCKIYYIAPDLPPVLLPDPF